MFFFVPIIHILVWIKLRATKKLPCFPSIMYYTHTHTHTQRERERERERERQTDTGTEMSKAYFVFAV